MQTTCPKWGPLGHNEVTVRGTVLFWRRYAVCCACGNERRLRSVQ